MFVFVHNTSWIAYLLDRKQYDNGFSINKSMILVSAVDRQAVENLISFV